MQIKQIAIVAAIASTFAMPLTSQASEIATLNGWGTLFSAAHAGQQAKAQSQAQGEAKLSLFQRPAAPAAKPAPVAQPAPEAMPAPAPMTEPAPEADKPVAQAPDMNAPEAEDQTATAGDSVAESSEAGQQNSGKAIASANASLSATVNLSGEQLGKVLNTVDGVYKTAGTVVEGVTGGVLGTVQNLADKTGSSSVAASMNQSGSMNVAGIASANVAGNLAATAGVMSAGQLSAVTAMTSSLVQNIIAARPASLTGLLR